MIRKTLTYLLLVLAVANAQARELSWYKFPVYSGTVDDMVATPSKIFYLSDGNLYSFDPEDNETYHYTYLNKLSDHTVDKIYYNGNKDYMLIVYTNGNMDVMLKDGRIVNMPDIKDANIDGNTVNAVSFDGDRMVVATGFGFVLVDDNRFEVIESGIYNCSIDYAAIVGDQLVIFAKKYTNDPEVAKKYPNYSILYSPVDVRHNNLDKFRWLCGVNVDFIKDMGDGKVVMRDAGSHNLLHRQFDFANAKVQFLPLDKKYQATGKISINKDGIYTYNDTQMIKIVEDDFVATPLPEAVQGCQQAFYSDPSILWIAQGDGISQIDFSKEKPVVLHEGVKPASTIPSQLVTILKRGAASGKIWVTNVPFSILKNFPYLEANELKQATASIDDYDVEDASAVTTTADYAYTQKLQTANGDKLMYAGMRDIVEDPENPNRYYIANYFEGVQVIERDDAGLWKETGKYNAGNSNIAGDNWASRVMSVDIDKEGNLWVGYEYDTSVSVLPAAKRKQDPAAIKPSDWSTKPALADMPIHHKDMSMLVCRHSDMVFYSMYTYGGAVLVAIDTKGTPANMADDNVKAVTRFIDQDGSDAQYGSITFITEDREGNVWCGTDKGVFEIKNPEKATGNDFTIRRIKVPRNDGTNYADYLLDSEVINWISVDPANRKWIATQASGLFLVSETGDRIIENYNIDNSPLPSNDVAAVECTDTDNTVYVGTLNGLYSFKSDASPGRQDYSEVVSYPNPVRPEYTGDVTIQGLKHDSLLKITDSAGNLIYETKSEGGMATWNVCNFSGQRVRSGVYYVYASENSGGTSTGAVTKILVIQ